MSASGVMVALPLGFAVLSAVFLGFFLALGLLENKGFVFTFSASRAAILRFPNFRFLKLPGFLLVCLTLGIFSGFGLAAGIGLMGLAYGLLSKSVPRWMENWRRQKKLQKLRELFPQALEMATQALQAGRTLPQVLEYWAVECPEPLREEWGRVRGQVELGASTQLSLEKMGERYPGFTEFTLFLDACRVSGKTGVSLGQLLRSLAEGLEEKNRILRKMDSMTAQAKLSGMVMGLLPLFLAITLFWMDPSLITPLFTQKAGWAILLLASFFEFIGFLWVRQILRLEI